MFAGGVSGTSLDQGICILCDRYVSIAPWNAPRKFSMASPSVSPCETTPGKDTTSAEKPPHSSRWIQTRQSKASSFRSWILTVTSTFSEAVVVIALPLVLYDLHILRKSSRSRAFPLRTAIRGRKPRRVALAGEQAAVFLLQQIGLDRRIELSSPPGAKLCCCSGRQIAVRNRRNCGSPSDTCKSTVIRRRRHGLVDIP